MTIVTITSTLVYHDGPLLCEARDPIGGIYLVMSVSNDMQGERFVVAGIDPERLRTFKNGLIDLLDAFAERVVPEWFIGRAQGERYDVLTLEAQNSPLLESNLLPMPGFRMRSAPINDTALSEAKATSKLVAQVTVNPKESVNHTIHANTLAKLLNLSQGIVKYAYSASLRKSGGKFRPNDPTRLDAHILNVRPAFVPGSFGVVFEADGISDLFGGFEITRAFRLLDQIFEHSGNPQYLIDQIKGHKGHLAGACLRLLQFVIEIDSPFSYSWAMPEFEHSMSRSISIESAGPALAELSQFSGLTEETIELVGRFGGGIEKKGTWFLEAEEGTTYRGGTRKGGQRLTGMQFGGIYRFTCIEEIKVAGVGSEIKNLYQTRYELITPPSPIESAQLF